MKSNFIENRGISLHIFYHYLSKITVDPTQSAIRVHMWLALIVVELTLFWKSRTILTMEMDKTHEIRDSVKRASTFPIVIRGDWLWKAANINDKNNSAAVYVQSTVKVHNPLFSVGKLLRNKLMQRFYWSIQSKW